MTAPTYTPGQIADAIDKVRGIDAERMSLAMLAAREVQP